MGNCCTDAKPQNVVLQILPEYFPIGQSAIPNHHVQSDLTANQRRHAPSYSYARTPEQSEIDACTPSQTVKEIFFNIQQPRNFENTQTKPFFETVYYIISLKCLYQGQWEFGKMNGFGTSLFSDGSIYQGNYLDSQFQGQGIKIFRDGSYIKGNFEKNQLQGQANMVKQEGFIYEGNFRNGQPHGQGKETWPNHTEYIGEYQYGMKAGKGVLKWSNGDSYEGDFKDNIFHGDGALITGESKYVGQFKHGQKFGKGKLVDQGKEFEGEFQHDEKHGPGILILQEGKKKIKANWENNLINGMADIEIDGKNLKAEYYKGKKVRWVFNDQVILEEAKAELEKENLLKPKIEKKKAGHVVIIKKK